MHGKNLSNMYKIGHRKGNFQAVIGLIFAKKSRSQRNSDKFLEKFEYILDHLNF